MASFRAFRQEITVKTAGLSPENISALLAQTAKDALAEAVRDGSASSNYRRYVNGREGVSENQVKAPGPIVYVFDYLDEVVDAALKMLRKLSPVDSGAYARGHFASVNGRRIEPEGIPPGAEVIITNLQPYSRKIETGAMKMRVPPGIYEGARQALFRQYRQLVNIEVKYLFFEGGYRLRRDGGKKGRRAGDPISYPSLVINMKA